MTNSHDDKKSKTGQGPGRPTSSSEASTVQPDHDDDMGEPSPTPEIDQHIRTHLGRKIKASYDEMVRQPVPDKFLHLLEELDRRENEE